MSLLKVSRYSQALSPKVASHSQQIATIFISKVYVISSTTEFSSIKLPLKTNRVVHNFLLKFRLYDKALVRKLNAFYAFAIENIFYLAGCFLCNLVVMLLVM